ncbi:ABC transporter ATP-binding protein [Thermococcus chitonophagus]|uniref:ABC transporter ATP-binding protein n=1 Tax=Thermococcus chitonophagus TaxID=54262 RepID=A0A161KJ53_9EURY|nr:ABC transporter ATP-binding protein [Thermococcus chitonophagus]ASJ16271.1 ABC transporter ATP-binding protein [Thermococcus chitonophagus]CUX78744.1 Ribose ABC transport system, ATP-binding protein RbsA (TC 3.A.1.2.1) [Thermococcus chitonophagus]
MHAVEMLGIVKVYPDGVVALKGVNLTVEQGEIHGLLGENGAGKSTLMRILYGEIKPTRGTIKIFGEEVNFSGPWDAIRKGIAMVYQHFTLVPTFTVLENLYLAMLSLNPRVTINEVEKMAREKMKELNFEVPLNEIVEELPVGVQQRVEILKALLSNAKILILDEPTSVLTPLETEDLFRTLRKLKESGITVIFITHKLREVKEITDRVTVLRRGEVVGVVETSKVSEKDLARMMVQRDVIMEIRKSPGTPGEPLLKVDDLWVRDDRGLEAVKGVSFDVRAGEILGIAGVQGNGQRELAEALAGIRSAEKGKIFLLGKDVTSLNAQERYKLGLAYVPDSRKVGLVYDMNITENVILTNLDAVTSSRRILWGKASSLAKKVVEEFEALVPSLSTPVKHLSGGNQQKIMVGREIVREPKVFIVSEPTQGLDVGATEFIRKTILRLRNEGKAVLLISTDLDEIIQLSDRIAVIYEGRIMAIGKSEEFSLERLGLLMGGVKGEA